MCRAGAYSWWRWLRDVVGVWQPIFHLDDPMPAVSRGLEMLGGRLKPLLPIAHAALRRRVSERRLVLHQRKAIPQLP